MSKTPVSTLEEYMAKRALGSPNWVIVEQTNGTHLASFTYKVICGEYTARGTAGSKKEAKHSAAREMLKLLFSSNNNTDLSPIKENATTSKNVSGDSYYLLGSENSHDKVFVNSVGKLNEYCLSRRYKDPQYSENGSSGPDHVKSFTIKCTIGSISAEGTASTKKQAKHEAAQQMYQLLIKTATPTDNPELCKPPEAKIIDTKAAADLVQSKVLSLKMEEPLSSMAESAQKAIKVYNTLKFRDTGNINKEVDITRYYEALKISVPEERREIVQAYLTDCSSANHQRAFEKVLKFLNMAPKYETLISRNNSIIVRVTLNRRPTTSEIGMGESMHEATERAHTNLIKTLRLLLR